MRYEAVGARAYRGLTGGCAFLDHWQLMGRRSFRGEEWLVCSFEKSTVEDATFSAKGCCYESSGDNVPVLRWFRA